MCSGTQAKKLDLGQTKTVDMVNQWRDVQYCTLAWNSTMWCLALHCIILGLLRGAVSGYEPIGLIGYIMVGTAAGKVDDTGLCDVVIWTIAAFARKTVKTHV